MHDEISAVSSKVYELGVLLEAYTLLDNPVALGGRGGGVRF